MSSDATVDPSRESERLRQIIRMALAFTSPTHDKAAWRVAAIDALPEAEHAHFYELLSRSN